jgi:hypothetical protein
LAAINDKNRSIRCKATGHQIGIISQSRGCRLDRQAGDAQARRGDPIDNVTDALDAAIFRQLASDQWADEEGNAES